MSEKFELAKIALLALSDTELAQLGLDYASPIRKVVRMYEDEDTSFGLDDLQDRA